MIFPATSVTCSLLNTFRDHWRGGQSLLMALLLPVLALHVAIGVLDQFIPLQYRLVWLLPCWIVLLWQLVGGWRTVDAHVSGGGSMSLVWPAYLLLLAVLVSTILRATDRIAIATPVSLPVAWEENLPFDPHTKTLELHGPINWPMHTALQRALAENPQVQTISLSSDGGLVFAARGIAKLIMSGGYDTHAVGECFSACTIVFVAGVRRSLAGGARLGFHRYALDQAQPLEFFDIAAELERDRRFFIQRGIAPEFVAKLYRAGPSELYQPTLDEMLASGLVNP